MNGVNNISVLVEELRVELEELVEDQNTPALVSNSFKTEVRKKKVPIRCVHYTRLVHNLVVQTRHLLRVKWKYKGQGHELNF